MKLQYWHAKNLQIAAKNPESSTERRFQKKMSAVLEPLTDENRKVAASNSLLVFVCVEKFDEGLRLKDVKEDILHAQKLIGVPQIVMGGFAHLSNTTAEPTVAKRITERLYSLVRQESPEAKLFPFGWDKSVDFHVPAHRFNCAFRSFEPKAVIEIT